MKIRITHKEVTLALGILVAIVVMITLWSGKPAAEPGRQTVALPSISVPKVTTHSIQTLVEVIF